MINQLGIGVKRVVYLMFGLRPLLLLEEVRGHSWMMVVLLEVTGVYVCQIKRVCV